MIDFILVKHMNKGDKDQRRKVTDSVKEGVEDRK